MSGSFRVAIEGNIGVGKSTLLPALADALPGAWNVLDERVDEDPEFKALLDAFYLNPNKQVELQSWITRRRIQDCQNIAQCPDNYLFERSFLGEIVFCHANLARHEKPEGRFISFFYQIVEALKTCRYDAVLYLRADPKICYDRIQARARMGEANTITYDYVHFLHNCYETHLIETARMHNIPLIDVDWTHFGNIDTLAAELADRLNTRELKIANG